MLSITIYWEINRVVFQLSVWKFDNSNTKQIKQTNVILMDYLSSDQVKKYILLNFSLFDLSCQFDLSNFRNPQIDVL